MDIQKIKELALANGFKLKEQASGNMDLNAYVYDFANAIEQAAKAQAVPEGFVLVKKRNLIGNPNVDFLQAPRWAKYWLMDGHSKKYWWSSVRPKKDMDLLCYVWGGQHFVGEAPSFGFAGPWNESLTSKKAMLEAQEPAND